MSRERKKMTTNIDDEIEMQTAPLIQSRESTPRSRYYNPKPALPIKTTLCATVLLIGGTFFLIMGILDLYSYYITNRDFNVSKKDWDKTYGFIMLGGLMFTPGSYSSFILYGAYQGWRGYSYDQVPSYDD